MTRALVALLVPVVMAAALWAAAADDPPKQLTAEERTELEARWREARSTGDKAYRSGNRAEATKAFEQALAVARRLYPADEFPDGHPDLAGNLNNLAVLYV